MEVMIFDIAAVLVSLGLAALLTGLVLVLAILAGYKTGRRK